MRQSPHHGLGRSDRCYPGSLTLAFLVGSVYLIEYACFIRDILCKRELHEVDRTTIIETLNSLFSCVSLFIR